MSQSNNIFFNKDNLVLALPLITLCTSYAYFTFLPLDVSIPGAIGLFIFAKVNYWLYSKKQSHSKENGDDTSAFNDSIVKELMEEEEEKEKSRAQKLEKKARHKQAMLSQKVAAARKAANKRNNGKSEKADKDEDETDVSMIVSKKQNKK